MNDQNEPKMDQTTDQPATESNPVEQVEPPKVIESEPVSPPKIEKAGEEISTSVNVNVSAKDAEAFKKIVGTAGKAMGKKPATANPKLLLLKNFLKDVPVPASSLYWKNKAPFPGRTYGNTRIGLCTIASQANLAMRMERKEQRKTLNVADDEVQRVYFALSDRLYGGGDNGAFEIDALSNWRHPDRTFRDDKGRPYTIDAFTRINQFDQLEVKRAIHTAGAHGIKVCLNLPMAFMAIDPPNAWDLPEDGRAVHAFEPGSAGGHSLMADGYDKNGVWLVHSWYEGEGVEYRQLITWRAFYAYCDEAYMVVDSANSWRKDKKRTKLVDVAGLIDAVNKVSSHKIKIK
jgi:hypothetical protein